MKLVSMILVALMCPVWAHAQGPATDSVEDAKVRFGPVGVTPSITVSTLVDSNVFFETDRPRQDAAVMSSPATRMWLRMGRGQLRFDGRGDLVYYRRYSGEGSLDGSIAAQYQIRANRITPWVDGRIGRGRQRVGYEIDARVERGERARAAGVDVRVLSNTSVGVYSSATDYWYGKDATFVGTELREALNRRSTTVGLSVSHKLTPLTSLVVQGETIRDRFDFSSVRDSDSRRVLVGLDLDSATLIPGRIRIGYREFESLDGASSFRGLAAAVSAGVTLGGRVRLAIDAQRDLEYSYDIASPYFIRAGGQVAAIGRITPNWELVGRAGRQNLDYRNGRAATTRVDTVDVYGGGLGYRIGSTLRLGVNVERERRMSVTHGRGYEGYRVAAGVTYGG